MAQVREGDHFVALQINSNQSVDFFFFWTVILDRMREMLNRTRKEIPPDFRINYQNAEQQMRQLNQLHYLLFDIYV